MKMLPVCLCLCVAAGVTAVGQIPPNQVSQEDQVVGNRTSTILGTVRDGGQALTFVTDERAWNVDNPETLKGHEGHYVRVNAFVEPDRGSLHITKVKLPTANESRRNDAR